MTTVEIKRDILKSLPSLIQRLEEAPGPCPKLDAEICEVQLRLIVPNVTWQQLRHVVEQVPCSYTSSFDLARGLSKWVLVHASDIGADGLPLVRLGNPGNVMIVLGVGQGDKGLARAMCAAALQALAIDLREEIGYDTQD